MKEARINQATATFGSETTPFGALERHLGIAGSLGPRRGIRSAAAPHPRGCVRRHTSSSPASSTEV